MHSDTRNKNKIQIEEGLSYLNYINSVASDEKIMVTIFLPDLTKMSVEVDKSTPLMDLLIHIATINKFSPAAHMIQLSQGSNGSCNFQKPSTPIGLLNTSILYIVPKSRGKEDSSKVSNGVMQRRPGIENSFRLQVHLPHNQLHVMRVKPTANLGDILYRICDEKDLDMDRCELRHPVNHEQRLCLNCSVLEYDLSEVKVVYIDNQSINNSLIYSKTMKDKDTGKLNLRKSKSSIGDSSASSDSFNEETNSREISPAPSELSHPLTSSPSHSPKFSRPPSRFIPRCKKRLAPRPPSHIPSSDTGQKNTLSAAYRPNANISKPTAMNEIPEGKDKTECREFKSEIEGNSTNLQSINSTSSTSLSSATRKRRAPQPPASLNISGDKPSKIEEIKQNLFSSVVNNQENFQISRQSSTRDDESQECVVFLSSEEESLDTRKQALSTDAIDLNLQSRGTSTSCDKIHTDRIGPLPSFSNAKTEKRSQAVNTQLELSSHTNTADGTDRCLRASCSQNDFVKTKADVCCDTRDLTSMELPRSRLQNFSISTYEDRCQRLPEYRNRNSVTLPRTKKEITDIKMRPQSSLEIKLPSENKVVKKGSNRMYHWPQPDYIAPWIIRRSNSVIESKKHSIFPPLFNKTKEEVHSKAASMQNLNKRDDGFKIESRPERATIGKISSESRNHSSFQPPQLSDDQPTKISPTVKSASVEFCVSEKQHSYNDSLKLRDASSGKLVEEMSWRARHDKTSYENMVDKQPPNSRSSQSEKIFVSCNVRVPDAHTLWKKGEPGKPEPTTAVHMMRNELKASSRHPSGTNGPQSQQHGISGHAAGPDHVDLRSEKYADKLKPRYRSVVTLSCDPSEKMPDETLRDLTSGDSNVIKVACSYPNGNASLPSIPVTSVKEEKIRAYKSAPADTRKELCMAIRNFGGQANLRKVSSDKTRSLPLAFE